MNTIEYRVIRIEKFKVVDEIERTLLVLGREHYKLTHIDFNNDKYNIYYFQREIPPMQMGR